MQQLLENIYKDKLDNRKENMIKKKEKKKMKKIRL